MSPGVSALVLVVGKAVVRSAYEMKWLRIIAGGCVDICHINKCFLWHPVNLNRLSGDIWRTTSPVACLINPTAADNGCHLLPQGIPPIMRCCITQNMASKFCEKKNNLDIPFKASLYSFDKYKFFWPHLVPWQPYRLRDSLRFMKKRDILPYFTNYNRHHYFLWQTVRYSRRHHLCKIKCNSTTDNLSY